MKLIMENWRRHLKERQHLCEYAAQTNSYAQGPLLRANLAGGYGDDAVAREHAGLKADAKWWAAASDEQKNLTLDIEVREALLFLGRHRARCKEWATCPNGLSGACGQIWSTPDFGGKREKGCMDRRRKEFDRPDMTFGEYELACKGSAATVHAKAYWKAHRKMSKQYPVEVGRGQFSPPGSQELPSCEAFETKLRDKIKKEHEHWAEIYSPEERVIDIYGNEHPYISVPKEYAWSRPGLHDRLLKMEKFINLWASQDWAMSQWFQPLNYAGINQDFRGAVKAASEAKQAVTKKRHQRAPVPAPVGLGGGGDDASRAAAGGGEHQIEANTLYVLHKYGIVGRMLRMIKSTKSPGRKICDKTSKVFYSKCMKDREIKKALLKELYDIKWGIEKYARWPAPKEADYQTGVYGLPGVSRRPRK